MIHFLRLIRPINLLMIAITMYSLGGFLDVVYSDFNESVFLIQTLRFFLLVLSVVLIAAAGNIINDYFDVETDEVNRSEKVVINRYIKKKQAFAFYIIFNGIGFLISIYLSLEFGNFAYIFIHTLSITLLWYYSKYLKKMFVIGNVVVAFLTAIVPVLVGVFYQNYWGHIELKSTPIFHLDKYDCFPLYLSFGFGIFAFLFNWTREMIKDMEDVQGDLVIKARTLPIVFGLKKTRTIVLVFLILILGASFPVLLFWSNDRVDGIAVFPLLLSAIFTIYTVFILSFPITHKRLKLADLGMKTAMIFGMFLPLFWMFLIMK